MRSESKSNSRGRPNNAAGPQRHPAILPLEPQQAHQRRSIGNGLARAFQGEPNFTYLLPDPKRRRRGLPWFFGSFVTGIALRYGVVDIVGDGSAAALWLRPGAAVAASGAVAAGLLMMPVRLGFWGTWRCQVLSRTIDAERSRRMPCDHWYLMALGVDPAKQGMGLGRALLEYGFARAEGSGAPCYLETFRARTTEFYVRYGFEVLGEERVGRTGPNFFPMAREGGAD